MINFKILTKSRYESTGSLSTKRFSLQTLQIVLAHNKRRTTALLLQIAQYLVNYCPLHTKYRNEAISMLDDNTVHAFLQEAYITEIKSSHNSGNHD